MSTPTMPPSLKRKAAAMEPEEDGPEKARRSRILSFMAPQNNKSHMPRLDPIFLDETVPFSNVPYTISYRILEALNAFRLKGGEAGSGQASMAGHQYMNGAPRPPPHSASQSHSQPVPSTPTPAPVAAQGTSPMDVEKTPQKDDAASLVAFNVPITGTNGSNTPLPAQPTHQFVNQHPPVSHPVPNGMQPQVYPSVQAATEAAKKPATPAQHLQMQQQIQQHYMQQYQQQQQQQSHPQNQPRPPSQPQHPQQLSPAHHQQQHFTQSPKLPAQSSATTPVLTQPTSQSFPAAQPNFQPSIPLFLQQPPGGRNGPGTQPTNQQHQQALYAQSLQHQQLLNQQQQNSNILMHQQRIAMAANVQRNAAGGRATPQAPVQVSAQQLQHPGQAATPSPVKNSPSVTHLAAQAARSSPMPAQAQLQQQQQQLSAQQMQMQMPPHPNRVAFTPQYNSSQLRPLHGNPPAGHMVVPNQGVATNSPTALGQNMTSSPQASGRSITPAIASGDGKQQSGQVQGQIQGLLQQPIRRQTPQQQLQGQLTAARAASQSRSPHTPQAQVKQQTPQLANRTPQLQQRTPQQLQQIQNQQSSPLAQVQTQVAQAQSQSQTQPQTQPPMQAQQQQLPGHPLYPQMYGYPQMNYQMPGAFWQQRSMPGMSTSGATPQQLLLMQQQHQHQQQQQQAQQPQQPQQPQQQVNVVGGQPIIVNSQQSQQGSIPIIANSQQMLLALEQKVKLAGQQQQQQALMNMSKIPGQGGKGKVGQKKAIPKRGGGPGR